MTDPTDPRAPRPMTISVGEPYPVTPAGGWPDGAVLVEWTRWGAMQLILSLARPTAREVKAAREGAVRLGVRAPRGGEPGQLIYWIDGLADGDAPYEPERLRPEARPDPAALAGRRLLLTILLLEAGRGTVRAIRGVTLSERASAAWRAVACGGPAEELRDVALGRAGGPTDEAEG